MKTNSKTSLAILPGSLALSVGVFLGLRALPPFIPCADFTAQALGLALCAGMGSQLVAWVWLRSRLLRWALAGEATLLLAVVWLGFYPFSPSFVTKRVPVLQGFNVLTRARGAANFPPGSVVTLAAGQPAAIQAQLLLEDVHCRWTSAQGGALDGPESCAMVYVPPQSESDILKVILEPGCGLPRSLAQLKISILP